MASFNGAMFGKDDEVEKKLVKKLQEQIYKDSLNAMANPLDRDLINAMANPLTDNKTAVADDGNPLTYDDILKAQESLKTGYGKEPKRPVYKIDKREYPVLHLFMRMPAVAKYITIEMSKEVSKDDPYGELVRAKIAYRIPKEEELEYKNGLHEFIMNYIADKELNEHEIEIFERIANDMTVEPKTLDDLNNIINQI